MHFRFKLFIHAIFIVVIVLAASPVKADYQDKPVALSLQSFTVDAFKKNAGLEAKKRDYEAARSRVIKTWLPEDPMIGVDVEGQSDFFDFDSRMNNEYMISQTIPFPTKLILNGVIASKEADIAYEKYQEEKRDLIWHIEEPYYELFMVKKTLSILEENQILLDQILQAVKSRYESNQASQDEFLKAQIELSKNGIEVFNMREKEHLAEAHFAHIVNEPLHTDYVLMDEEKRSKLPDAREELEKLALSKRPELRAFKIGVERAKANATLMHTEWLPDITGRLETREFEDGRPRENDTFIGVSVPVWSLLKGIGGGWKSASEEVRAAEAMYEDMKNEVLLKVHEAYSKVKSAENAIQIYENFILPQAKQQVQVALSSYASGKTPFISLIDGQRTLKSAQMEYYKAVADYEMGLADLRLAVGDDLNDPVKGVPNGKK